MILLYMKDVFVKAQACEVCVYCVCMNMCVCICFLGKVLRQCSGGLGGGVCQTEVSPHTSRPKQIKGIFPRFCRSHCCLEQNVHL